MSATPDMLAIFYEPTPPSEIRQRQGPGGRTLDYIDARYVMDTLDKLGPENWQDRYEDRADGSVRCGIGINVEGEWIWKWDVGTQSDIEPEKGSHSEAFKRAGVKWGIARDLYGHTTQARGVSSTPRASQSPRPVSPPAPVGASNPDNEPPFPGEVIGFRAPAAGTVLPDPRDGYYGDTCPVHVGRAWRETARGIKCTANDGTRENPDWCTWKPSQRWVAEHEMAQ
jgi:hypothetical protein